MFRDTAGLLINSCGNLVSSKPDKLVCLVDMEDTVVVDTPDALLVCPRASSGKVRDIVRNLNDKHDERALFHQTVFCPWDTLYHYGEFPDLQDQEYGHLPGKSLSLQLHHHRGEHWVVVTGMTCV